MPCPSDEAGTEMEIARAGDRILVRRRAGRRILSCRACRRDPISVRRLTRRIVGQGACGTGAHRFAHKLVHREECFACLDERNDLDPSAERKYARSGIRSEEHTSELQSLMRSSYAV